MARFDDLVTDPSLRRDALLEWVETRERDEFYADRYRVMTTSGSSAARACSSTTGPAGPGSGASSCAGRRGWGDARPSRAAGSRCCAARR